MFESATIKLTGWYLLILMSISLIFSVAIYQIASNEIGRRLEDVQSGLQSQVDLRFPANFDFRQLRELQLHQANNNLLIGLAYSNLLILISGGLGCYLLARRTLKPLEEAHEAQSRFTSDASHELRTPLAAMRTELEVALRDPTTTKAEMRELLASNLEEVHKLSRLSHVLLQLSRLDHGNIEQTVLALQDAIQAATARFDQSRLEVNVPDKPVRIEANGESIEELITILTDNAYKYSPAGSQIALALTKKASTAVLSITNEGRGIAEQDIDHIFDRFYRADASRTKGDKPGYGLGLSLAKKIVEIHGGEISVASTPDKFTTFSVTLPLEKSFVKKLRN